MSLGKIVLNCHEYLEISDDDFLRFLTIVLGDIDSYMYSDGSVIIRFLFKNTHVTLCYDPGWYNISDYIGSLDIDNIDMRITKKLFQRLINYGTK